MERIVSIPHPDDIQHPLDAWWVADLLAEQSRILEQEYAALLREEGADLQPCPDWCVHANLPVHADAFDSDPVNAPHRSMEHTVHASHGGSGIDRAGRAEVGVQLEQDRDRSTGPMVTLAVTVRGIEQYAWLTLPEAGAVRDGLDGVLDDTAG